MNRSAREAFLAGDRTDDVALYFADSYMDADALAEKGERVGDGVVLVVPGEQGRALFQRATGLDPMAFAREAGGTDGEIDRDLGDATCPEIDGESGGEGEASADADAAHDDHHVEFIFAFAQEQTPDAGGRYAEGDVIHAYATCACNTAFSERWVA